jgi:hypothetical protein
MKKIILTTCFLFSITLSFGQDFNQLSEYEFTDVESYKTQEANVLMCANYLFSKPMNKNDRNRYISLQYIIKWMSGTPDYTFDLGEKSMELTRGNQDLLGLYMAAMTKVVLENGDSKLNGEEIYQGAEDLLVEYCSDSSNNMKPSRKIKKIMKTRKS